MSLCTIRRSKRILIALSAIVAALTLMTYIRALAYVVPLIYLCVFFIVVSHVVTLIDKRLLFIKPLHFSLVSKEAFLLLGLFFILLSLYKVTVASVCVVLLFMSITPSMRWQNQSGFIFFKTLLYLLISSVLCWCLFKALSLIITPSYFLISTFSLTTVLASINEWVYWHKGLRFRLLTRLKWGQVIAHIGIAMMALIFSLYYSYYHVVHLTHFSLTLMMFVTLFYIAAIAVVVGLLIAFFDRHFSC